MFSAVGTKEAKGVPEEEDLVGLIRSLIQEALANQDLGTESITISGDEEGPPGDDGEDGEDGKHGWANLFPMQIVDASYRGNAIYKCHLCKADSSEWADTAGADKIAVQSGSGWYSILNLCENDPGATYDPALATGDRMVMGISSDDAGVTRNIGFPVTSNYVRRAITTQAAPSDTKITANLYGSNGSEITSGLGSGIDVYGNMNGGGNLDVSVPLLKDNRDIFVINIQGKWWCVEPFNTGQTAIAYVKTTPGAVTSLSCWFSESDSAGQTISVPCTVAGGGNLNAAIPRVTDGLKITVTKNGATWSTGVFQATEDCACS